MIDIVALLFALFVLAVSTVIRPTHAECPVGSYVEGVRPSGFTRCMLPPSGPEQDCSGTRRCVDESPVRYTTPLQIYCTGGSRPVVVDERTVGCQRGGWTP